MVCRVLRNGERDRDPYCVVGFGIQPRRRGCGQRPLESTEIDFKLKVAPRSLFTYKQGTTETTNSNHHPRVHLVLMPISYDQPTTLSLRENSPSPHSLTFPNFDRPPVNGRFTLSIQFLAAFVPPQRGCKSRGSECPVRTSEKA
jgi:hypothetical protein